MDPREKAWNHGEYSPSGSGEFMDYGIQLHQNRSMGRRALESFKRDPNAHATPKGTVGSDGKVFDVEGAAQATATSPLCDTRADVSSPTTCQRATTQPCHLAEGGPARACIIAEPDASFLSTAPQQIGPGEPCPCLLGGVPKQQLESCCLLLSLQKF